MLSQMVFIHITLLLLDPHDIHHEGKNNNNHNQILISFHLGSSS